MDAFRRVLGEGINPLPEVVSTTTYVRMEPVTEGLTVPVPAGG